MRYASLKDGVVDYPYTQVQWAKENNASMRLWTYVSAEGLNAIGVYPVVIEDPPVFDAFTEDVVRNEVPDIIGTQAVLGWTVVQLDEAQKLRKREHKIEEIKSEANRRIVEVMPMTKQLNTLAESLVLVLAILNDNANVISTENQAKVDAVLSTWEYISSIRNKSDELEELPVLPLDVSNDTLWELNNV